ncbi:MAG: beta-lactamase family protein [Anaerolineae bacterium]|nr:beta-lactamase family protein [Anaerolineae bacterium]
MRPDTVPPAELGSAMKTFENRFQQLVDQRELVGMAFAVVYGSETAYIRGLGVTGVEDYRLPVTPDTLFAIGSITKAVAAATMMCLVEQQILDLDRPIVEVIEGFAFEDKTNGRQVTLRHLLSHSSGLPAAGRNWALRGRDALRTFVWEDLRVHQFVAPPGKVHIYSNTAISSAAYVAEVVTGTPFDDLVRQLVFDPLDMQRSTFDLAEAMTYPTALPHGHAEDGSLRVIHRLADNDMGHASSFCFCSTHDLAKFAAALLMPGKLLRAETLYEMQTPVIGLHTSGANYPGALMNAAYGLGLSVGEYRGSRLVRHGGMNQSYNCFMEIFPDQQIAVVLQTNYMDDEGALNILFELFDELLKPTPPLRPPAPAEIPYRADEYLAGEYLNPVKGIQTISANEGHLILNGEYPLTGIGEGRFYYQIEELRFPVAFPDPGTLIVRGTPYHHLQRKTFEPDLAQWQALVGVFIDPFTPYPEETAIHVRFAEDRIWINDTAQEALSNNRFTSSDGLYEFLDEDTLQVCMGIRYVRRSRLQSLAS